MARKKKAAQAASATPQNLYLCQYTYTAQAWDDLILGDEAKRDRIKAVSKLVERLGGCFPQITITCGCLPPGPTEKFITFGDHDVVVLLAFPDDSAAAAFAMAIQAGGAVSSFKTTRLLPWSLGLAAMSAAAVARKESKYLAPGG